VSYEECACVGGCENCEQLDYAAIIGDAKRFERARIIEQIKKHGVQIVEDNWEDSRAVNDAYIDLINGGTK
jgi:phage major head subunit gpT-like protein